MIIIDKDSLNSVSANKLTAADMNTKRMIEMSSSYFDKLIEKFDAKLDKFEFTIVKTEKQKPKTLFNIFREPTTINVNSMLVDVSVSASELQTNMCCSKQNMLSYIENHYKAYYEAKCSMYNEYATSHVLQLKLTPPQ
jgi:hypothetical protein